MPPTDEELRPLRSSYPVTSILNPAFVYVESSKTDVRATIERARKRLAEQRQTVTTVRSFSRGRKR